MIIAIDPGLSGGIAKLTNEGHFVSCVKMPTKWVNESRREIDAVALVPLLHGGDPVVVERSRAMPMQGVVSCYRIGENAGVIRGVCAALGLPMYYVEPSKWKKFYNLPGGRDNKPLAVSRAIDLFPMAPLNGDKREGMSEALLMARYYCCTMLSGASQSSESSDRASKGRSRAETSPR